MKIKKKKLNNQCNKIAFRIMSIQIKIFISGKVVKIDYLLFINKIM